MRYCPTCREEFQDWVKLCPDCSLSLVDSLPELSKPEPKKEPIKEPLVHVATAPNESVATMWVGILKDEGIDSFIKGGDWFMNVAIPSYPSSKEIHVLASQAEKAKKLLEPLIDENESMA